MSRMLETHFEPSCEVVDGSKLEGERDEQSSASTLPPNGKDTLGQKVVGSEEDDCSTMEMDKYDVALWAEEGTFPT